jgi:hypothetical protein
MSEANCIEGYRVLESSLLGATDLDGFAREELAPVGNNKM